MRSFTNPETHFHLVEHQRRVVDGEWTGEPTGDVECVECGAQHANIDEIPHAPDCSQRFVKSAWWQTAARDG